MDSGAVPRHSHHLVGLPPSTYPPPLGEGPTQSRTMSHIDSHTMGDQSEDIYEPPSPIRVDDGDFTLSYDPSPDLTQPSLVKDRK